MKRVDPKALPEELLRENDDLAPPVGGGRVDADGRFTLVNAACDLRLTGYSRAVPSELLFRLVHPEDLEALQRSFAGLTPQHPDCQRESLGGVNFDVTERKLAQATLEAALREKDVLLHEVHHRRVMVRLASDPAGLVRLRVADNGVRLSAGFDLLATQSLGLRLVQLLAGHLRGPSSLPGRSRRNGV